MNTAGRAVLFAGATVVIALLGMFALGVSLLNGVAVAAAIGVLLRARASLTLLPALLSVIGDRVGGSGAPRGAQAPARARARLLAAVGRRRSSAARRRRDRSRPRVMLALAAPALGAAPRLQRRRQRPGSQTTRQAYDLLAKGFGPGFNGPLLARRRSSRRPGDAGRARAGSRGARRHARDRLGRAAARSARTGGRRGRRRLPDDVAAERRDHAPRHPAARHEVLPPVERSTGATRVRRRRDGRRRSTSRTCSPSKLPLFIGVVVGLAALLLLVVFRSLVIPVQAAVMNLLSIGASLGVVAAVFERGWLGGLFGTSPARSTRSSRCCCSRSCSASRWTTRCSSSRASTRSGRAARDASARGRARASPAPAG